ncbi:hypothetical protein SAXI111661_05040 [Saccharomonospora xinjiangensis]|nr:hypothetical protein EYD13_02750 [Saccharomonospora xinjiangensis]
MTGWPPGYAGGAILTGRTVFASGVSERDFRHTAQLRRGAVTEFT